MGTHTCMLQTKAKKFIGIEIDSKPFITQNILCSCTSVKHLDSFSTGYCTHTTTEQIYYNSLKSYASHVVVPIIAHLYGI